MSRHLSTSRLLTAARAASLGVALVGAASSAVLAQRGPRAAPPAGAEIAARAKGARLDRANAGTGEFQGKRIVFTPAMLDATADLAAGQMLGVLENEVAGDETGLPAGRYNVFAAQLADGWHVYAESNGQIVKEALRVTVARRPGPPADRRPRFRAAGWGYDIDFEREPLPPPVASVTVTPSSLSALVGESKQFTVELRDAAGNLLTGRAVSWSSSAPGIASASTAGVVTGVAAGQATITATSGGKSGSATVTVPPIRYTVYVSGSSPLSAGQTTPMSAYLAVSSCYSCGAINWSEVTWASSNPAVATVYNTRTSYGSTADVRGVAEGSAVITASYRGFTGTRALNVTRALVTAVSVAPSPVTVVIGQAAQLAATVRDATGATVTDRPVTWSSANPAVADVTSAGRVIGIAVGSTTVKATADGVSTSSAVLVNPVPVSTVAVSPADASIGAGQYTQLEAALRDAAGNVLTGRTVTWTTDNTAIADVTASGRVLAVAPGSATITATSEGKSGTATVAVPGPSSGGGATTTTMTESISFNW